MLLVYMLRGELDRVGGRPGADWHAIVQDATHAYTSCTSARRIHAVYNASPWKRRSSTDTALRPPCLQSPANAEKEGETLLRH